MVGRFVCPTAHLDLRKLVRRTQSGIWTALGLTVALHLSLSQLSGWHTEKRMTKPLTTQFVKRQPRLTKPLEMRKRPRPRQRKIQREMVSAKVRSDRQKAQLSTGAAHILGTLSTPDIALKRSLGAGRVSMEPETVAEMVESAKEAEHIVDTALEMMDIQALDTGKYHAMVIVDPNDRTHIKGFFHLALAYSINSPKDYGVGEQSGSIWYAVQAIPHLVAAVN